MPLRKIIYAEFRKMDLRAGYVWQAQHMLNLRCKLNPQCYGDFDTTIANLCNEGILNVYPRGSIYHYKLTEKGETSMRDV